MWELIDKIEELYLSREYSYEQIGGILGISVSAVQKTLNQLNYNHTLKRNADTRLNEKLINGVHTPD